MSKTANLLEPAANAKLAAPQPAPPLDGKSIIVTGGARGLGGDALA